MGGLRGEQGRREQDSVEQLDQTSPVGARGWVGEQRHGDVAQDQPALSPH
ncbi:MAG: hypothetical protein ACRDV9_00680 [Acidimicrobiia bacterium]